MEKRFITFLLASVLFYFVWTQLFPPPTRPVADPAAEADTPAVPVDPAASPPAPVFAPPAAVPEVPGDVAPDAPARTVVVTSPLYEYGLTTHGAGFTGAELLRFESYVRPGERVQLVSSTSQPVLSQRVAIGPDTLDLRRLAFQASAERLELAEGDAPAELRFTSAAGPVQVEVVYTFHADDYRVDVAGRIGGVPAGATLLTELGDGLAPHDAPEHGSERELAMVGWDANRIQRQQLRKVRVDDSIPGPLVWAGIKDRYFLVALINEGQQRFSAVRAIDAPDLEYTVDGARRVAPRARTFTVLPLAADGSFRFEAYLGPQEHGRLAAVGHELQEVNPYGYRWLRPVIRPIAAAILWVLNQLHDTFGIAYGWVLVIFGFAMRIITWPLNARAMRSQMKNMAVQPQLQARMKEIQAKYKDRPDAAAQQREMMEMYKELGVNPFSMLSGCLPMLIPMPVLITLFFVFQGAIEFRGTSFAWLADLSLRDPYYLLPIFLVVSMFGLQWVSMRMSGMEQNPQMKMMLYFMPLMMGAIFWIMPAGLNLYYASTNVASFPQQILIARERKKAMEEQKAKDAAKKKAAAALVPGGGPRQKKKKKR